MSELCNENRNKSVTVKQKEYDDSPSGLTTAPIQGYTAINSREKVEVIERVAPVLAADGSIQQPVLHKSLRDPPRSSANGYGNLNKSKGYGNLGGRSSLLQQRLKAGSIQHFDSGDHFLQQARKSTSDKEEINHDNRPHPLTAEPSTVSKSIPVLSNSLVDNNRLNSGRIGRIRPRPSVQEEIGLKPVEAVPRRFKEVKESSDEESEGSD